MFDLGDMTCIVFSEWAMFDLGDMTCIVFLEWALFTLGTDVESVYAGAVSWLVVILPAKVSTEYLHRCLTGVTQHVRTAIHSHQTFI